MMARRLAKFASMLCAVLVVMCVPASFAQCHAGNVAGNVPYPPGGPYQGVSFRVWAPHASSVSVKSPITNESMPLTMQGTSGYWCVDVPGIGVNQYYDYVITTPGFGTVTRRDPNAREVTHARNGHAITYDPTTYVWHDQNFQPVPLNKLAISKCIRGLSTQLLPSGEHSSLHLQIKRDRRHGL